MALQSLPIANGAYSQVGDSSAYSGYTGMQVAGLVGGVTSGIISAYTNASNQKIAAYGQTGSFYANESSSYANAGNALSMATSAYSGATATTIKGYSDRSNILNAGVSNFITGMGESNALAAQAGGYGANADMLELNAKREVINSEHSANNRWRQFNQTEAANRAVTTAMGKSGENTTISSSNEERAYKDSSLMRREGKTRAAGFESQAVAQRGAQAMALIGSSSAAAQAELAIIQSQHSAYSMDILTELSAKAQMIQGDVAMSQFDYSMIMAGYSADQAAIASDLAGKIGNNAGSLALMNVGFSFLSFGLTGL